jgi:pyridoxal phosphate enzyme (YggS family)
MMGMDVTTQEARRDHIAERLATVRARIDAACALAGRTDPVTLMVVTKTLPASDVVLLQELGVIHVGENRDQEAGPKRRDVSDAGLQWHMIGQVQRNKAASVARWADVVESMDRLALVEALSKGAVAADRLIDVLIQVNLDPHERPERGGVAPGAALELADCVAAAPGLVLRGVMGVAPVPEDGAADQAFALLAEVRGLLGARHPMVTQMSAGMSGDLEEAIVHGATQVRIGGAVLGSRPPVQ